MLKFGSISTVDADKGLAKVSFEDLDIITDWLPILVSKTKEDKFFYIPDVGEHVACMMDEHCDTGVILGAVYSKDEPPGAVKGDGITGVEFSNNDLIKYDKTARKLTAKINTTELHLATAGPTLKKGSESLKTILADLLTQLEALTVTTAMGPSSVPINIVAITAIKTRINAFFEN